MTYWLYKLRFSAPLHVGDGRLANGPESARLNIPADTLFSALCHAALRRGGEEALRELADAVRAGRLLFSDTFPFKGDTIFLPKPVIPSRSDREADSVRKKALKKMEFLPLESLDDFMASVFGIADFDPRAADTDFAVSVTSPKVNLRGEKPNLHSVSAYAFHDDCGLYGIVRAGAEDFARFFELLRFLGLGGIGGKISSGYGKFEALRVASSDDASAGPYVALFRRLTDEEAEFQTALTVCLPADDETEAVTEDAAYKLIRRGGFVRSASAPPLKKQTLFCFAAGSVFRRRFAGMLCNVAPGGPHPAYRYLKPLFLGLRAPTNGKGGSA